MRNLVVIMSVLLCACSPKIETPEQLIGQMKTMYGASYFKTLTFTQRTVHTSRDGETKEEMWYETMRVPGDLSIRFDPVSEGNGILFTEDSVFSYEQGVARVARPMVHPLLLLGFDVYALSVEETIAKLEKLGFDLSVMDEGTWLDRPVYIVGAKAGNDTTKQFWVDKERLVLVRTMEPRMRMMMEVQFHDYQQIEGSWVGAEVQFLRDGQRVTEEYYTNLKANVDIDEREFDPERWGYAMENQ